MRVITFAEVETLLEQVGRAYRQLPREPYLALKFRETLTREGLPGGYAKAGVAPRAPLAKRSKIAYDLLCALSPADRAVPIKEWYAAYRQAEGRSVSKAEWYDVRNYLTSRGWITYDKEAQVLRRCE
jgi:hypothetical protein